MELRHLRYFMAVADEGHFGRAAARLHISQPPLTRQIKQLEAEIGAELFTRTPRGAELTDAGRVFATDARQILDLADRAADRAARAGRGELGRLDIAVFGTGIYGVIPTLLRAFRSAHPDVDLVLHNMTKDEQLQALGSGRIALAFNRLMEPVEGITSEVLLTEPLFVAIPADHRLVGRTAVAIDDLAGEPLVLYPTGMRPSFIDEVYALCEAAGFSPNVVAEVAEYAHGIVHVATGGALSVVPRSATNIAVPGVIYRPISGAPRPGVDLCVIHRTDDDSPLLGRLLASLRRSAATPV